MLIERLQISHHVLLLIKGYELIYASMFFVHGIASGDTEPLRNTRVALARQQTGGHHDGVEKKILRTDRSGYAIALSPPPHAGRSFLAARTVISDDADELFRRIGPTIQRGHSCAAPSRRHCAHAELLCGQQPAHT
ncbi:hypothetical protein ACL02S_10065 [Nocardia sp. 004]|uniref:hypothetical protein n=1 Tax=Nocardia sp. 004 TaxID=3385978 RepID=UPI0039A15ECE